MNLFLPKNFIYSISVQFQGNTTRDKRFFGAYEFNYFT